MIFSDSSGDTMKQGHRPKIVVIDDEQRIVDVICEMLNDLGMHTVSCTRGHEAIDCIRNTQPQAVLLDVQMPFVDGVQIFQMMRADPMTQMIPVIFCTANAARLIDWLPELQQMRATILPKPFKFDTLIGMVNQALAS